MGALVVLLVFLGAVFGAAPLERAVLAVVSPVTGAMVKTTDVLAGLFGAFANLWDVYAENQRLKEEHQGLAAMRGEYEDLKRENAFLRAQLHVADPKDLSLLDARVVSFDPLSMFQYVLIDKGTRDNVAEGMPVVRPGNVLVGKVSRAYPAYSHVALISDKTNKVSVKSAEGDTNGVLSGALGNLLLMELVEKNAQLASGHLIVTSGLDGVYPKNLIVGWVKEVVSREEGIFKEAYVTPVYAGFAHTQAFVITNYMR